MSRLDHVIERVCPGVLNGGQQGFTLLELMIAMLIVALMAGFAYPLYTDQVRSARRGDAIRILLQLTNRQSSFHANYRTYTTLIAGPDGCEGSACGLGFADTGSSDGHYSISVAAGAGGIGSSYTLRAAPVAGRDQANDKCGTLTLDHKGVQGVSGADAGVTARDCW